jgi:spore germination cell wall hydrolase CwlJ-like protein
MKSRPSHAVSRADRVLVATLAIVLATASAAVGAALTYSPRTDDVRVAKVVQPVVQTIVASVPQPLTAKAKSDVVLAELLAEHRCLSEVMYYEARGEGVDGQKAVAEVVFHRMRHGDYGHSICAVVYEGAGHPGCQFSFACDGELAVSKSAEAWRETQILAARILTGEVRLADTTGDATHFHAVSVSPDWSVSGEMERTVQIGNHVFYRYPTRDRSL